MLAVVSLALPAATWGQDPCSSTAATAVGYEPVAIVSGRRVLRVGPGQTLATPTAAARVARDGDAVLIEAADYRDSRAVWPQSQLLIRGVDGRPHLVAGGELAQGQGDLGRQRRRRDHREHRVLRREDAEPQRGRDTCAGPPPHSARRVLPRQRHGAALEQRPGSGNHGGVQRVRAQRPRERQGAQPLYRLDPALRAALLALVRRPHRSPRQEPRQAEPDRVQPPRRRAGRTGKLRARFSAQHRRHGDRQPDPSVRGEPERRDAELRRGRQCTSAGRAAARRLEHLREPAQSPGLHRQSLDRACDRRRQTCSAGPPGQRCVGRPRQPTGTCRPR